MMCCNHGFRPLFVMTNTDVQQKCHWGFNGTRLTSMDNGAVSLFSDIFQNLGVYRLSDASDFVEMHKNGLGITNKPMTMLFMAVPAINKKPVEGQCKKLKSSSCIPRTFYKLLEEQSTTIQE